MSTISTSTTTNTGYVVTSDTTGALVIQTGATPTTAMTVSSAQVVTLANALPAASGGTGVTTSTGTGANVLGTSPTITTPTISSLSSASATALTLQSAGTTAITVDTSQNVGIGETSPAGSAGYTQLVIKGASGAELSLKGGTTQYGYVYVDSGGFRIINPQSGASSGTMQFSTSNTERMRIDSSGNVGIGTTPSAWASGDTVIQIKAGTGNGSLWGRNGTLRLGNNFYYDGTNYKYANSTYAPMNYEINSGSFTWNYAPVGTAGNNVSFSEAMRIDSSGNVGIGTSSPSQKLSVLGVIGASGSSGGNASNPSATHTSSSSVRVGLRGNLMTSDNAALYGVGTYLANNLFFKNATGYPGYIESAPACYIGLVNDVISFQRIGTGTANADITSFSESMRIDSSGNLLVGTTNTSPGYGNTNTGVAVKPGSSTCFSASVADYALVSNQNTKGDATNYYHWNFRSANTNVGSIMTQASSTSYNTTSDYRLKENVSLMAGALAKVLALKPVTYTWKVDGSAGQGFIAHELQAIVPDCVSGEKDAVYEDGSIKPQQIDTSFLVATLTAAIQEQQALITALQANITALKEKVGA